MARDDTNRWRWGRWLAGGVALAAAAAVMSVGGCQMFDMPGESYTGPRPAADPAHQRLQAALRDDVAQLSQTIGPRHVAAPDALAQAEQFVAASLRQTGYTVERQTYDAQGVTCANLIVEIEGQATPDEIVVVGAHYDSVPDVPAANDNASGVAGLLALARAAAEADAQPKRTLRFVAFVNEEPPFFQTPKMGSYVYAKRCHDRGENIVGMISLDGIGYYTDQADTQRYPLPFLDMIYPSTGDFIALVGNWSSRDLVHQAVGTFRDNARFPSQGGAVPNVTPEVGFSDHWSFWQFDYPALMVTDTLPFRDPHYHTPNDTIEHLDFDAMAHVVVGLKAVVFDLARLPSDD